ncbi:hypothetical protein CCUS01_17363 [Colletotrichum cuscutae]|uniref:Uncharacterized protein n=1 Tax=Colletotrichum cuscutae TaxID=1209917 RepID=A0AAI9Y3L5_9PEZI|nr:hypothetical protein CCUS01_17363 [Colletotrichum cuscutae]
MVLFIRLGNGGCGPKATDYFDCGRLQCLQAPSLGQCRQPVIYCNLGMPAAKSWWSRRSHHPMRSSGPACCSSHSAFSTSNEQEAGRTRRERINKHRVPPYSGPTYRPGASRARSSHNC